MVLAWCSCLKAAMWVRYPPYCLFWLRRLTSKILDIWQIDLEEHRTLVNRQSVPREAANLDGWTNRSTSTSMLRLLLLSRRPFAVNFRFINGSDLSLTRSPRGQTTKSSCMSFYSNFKHIRFSIQLAIFIWTYTYDKYEYINLQSMIWR